MVSLSSLRPMFPLHSLPKASVQQVSFADNFHTGTDGIINGTMAIMVTDMDLYVTPFNTSMLNPHM